MSPACGCSRYFCRVVKDPSIPSVRGRALSGHQETSTSSPASSVRGVGGLTPSFWALLESLLGPEYSQQTDPSHASWHRGSTQSEGG